MSQTYTASLFDFQVILWQLNLIRKNCTFMVTLYYVFRLVLESNICKRRVDKK